MLNLRSITRIIFLLSGFTFIFASALMMNSVQAQESSTPTPDRLAQPTLPASPSQADKGAQVYWLSCLPCHGDVGQGLTDEFRKTYPPEEEYCWDSGCHGAKPYADGFTIPKTIPALIGTGTLQKFPNAFVLHAYIKAAMPFWKPGTLTDEESWQVTAFVLRQNRIIPNTMELNEQNAGQVMVGVPLVTPTPQPTSLENISASPYFVFTFFLFVLMLLILLQRRLRKS